MPLDQPQSRKLRERLVASNHKSKDQQQVVQRLAIETFTHMIVREHVHGVNARSVADWTTGLGLTGVSLSRVVHKLKILVGLIAEKLEDLGLISPRDLPRMNGAVG